MTNSLFLNNYQPSKFNSTVPMELNKKPIIAVIGKQGQGKSYLCNLMSDNRQTAKNYRIFKEGTGVKAGVTQNVKIYETKKFGGKPGREAFIIDMPGIFQKNEDNSKETKVKPESIRILEELNSKIQEETNGELTFFLFCVSLIQRWDMINTKILQIVKKFVPNTRIVLVGTQKNKVSDDETTDNGDEIKELEKEMEILKKEFGLGLSFLTGNQFDDNFEEFYTNMRTCDNIKVKKMEELSKEDLKEVIYYIY